MKELKSLLVLRSNEGNYNKNANKQTDIHIYFITLRLLVTYITTIKFCYTNIMRVNNSYYTRQFNSLLL